MLTIIFLTSLCILICLLYASLLQKTFGQLKDLVELKDQLEDIQKRVEDEIQAGLPPVRVEQTDNPEVMLVLESCLGARLKLPFSLLLREAVCWRLLS